LRIPTKGALNLTYAFFLEKLALQARAYISVLPILIFLLSPQRALFGADPLAQLGKISDVINLEGLGAIQLLVLLLIRALCDLSSFGLLRN
jgi:hypothetical protein